MACAVKQGRVAVKGVKFSVLALSSVIAASVVFGAMERATAADGFPDGQTINLVSWSAAGSPKDVMAREVAKSLKKQFGWRVAVLDVTGGGGAAAMHYLLNQPSNALTLIAASGSMELSLQTSLKSLFSLKDFEFVSQIQTDPFVMVVKADSPFKTMADLEAKGRNGRVSVAGFGADSDEHLVAADLAKQHNFSITWIPYSGGSKAITALLGNNVEAVLTNLSQTVPLVEGGKLRILGATTAKPIENPAAPSFASMRYKNMERSLWRGFVAKAGASKDRIETLSKAFAKLADDPDYLKYTKRVHITVKYLGPDDFRKSVEASMKQSAAEISLLGH
jgi:tripartite-type tricarboxylate transporter receptor subunit TctC